MKKLLVTLALFSLASVTSAEGLLRYEGKFFDNSNPLENQIEIRFSLWKTGKSGSGDFLNGEVNEASENFAGFQELQTLKGNNGFFSTLIGEVNPLPKLNPEIQKYLQVEIKKEGEVDFKLIDQDNFSEMDRKFLDFSPYALSVEVEAGEVRLEDESFLAKNVKDALIGLKTLVEQVLNSISNLTASQIKFSPTAQISATGVQAAIEELSGQNSENKRVGNFVWDFLPSSTGSSFVRPFVATSSGKITGVSIASDPSSAGLKGEFFLTKNDGGSYKETSRLEDFFLNKTGTGESVNLFFDSLNFDFSPGDAVRVYKKGEWGDERVTMEFEYF